MTDPARIRLLDSEAGPGEANPAPIIRLGGHAAHAPLTLRQARKAVRAEKRRARRRLREARRSAKAVAKEQIRQSERLALGAAAAAHAEAIARLRQLEESTTLSKQEQTAQRVRL